jgi:hypothetical protein
MLIMPVEFCLKTAGYQDLLLPLEVSMQVVLVLLCSVESTTPMPYQKAILSVASRQ